MAEFDTRIQQKIDTQINFETQNPILLNGELAIVKMTDGSIKFKIGNGTLNFNSLDYVGKEIVEQLVQIQQELDNIPDVSEFVTAIDEVQQVSAITPEFVQSFNGRSGNVLPQNGDYTAEMVGAAPAGFGWGDTVPLIQATSADEPYETYCQKIDAVLSGMSNRTAKLINAYPPQIYGRAATTVSILYKPDDSYASLFNVGSADISFSGWRMFKAGGVWYPFEWVNPPMQLGVEYRTTERFNGKPVYTMLFDFGYMPVDTGKVVAHNITNIEQMLTVTGSVVGGAANIPTQSWMNGYWENNVDLIADRTNIQILTKNCNTSFTENITAYITLKYTKTTDQG